MSDITLSSAVRQNLLSLQSTADLLGKTQLKLSTGKKVNSALDNPNAFFTASGLNNRASDLSSLLDDMGQAIQTIKAADQGIQAITELTEAAKAKANQALQASSGFERATFAAEYNALLTQIENIAEDSGYKGKNLLGGTGNDLTVTFNEDATNSQTIAAVDYTDTTSATNLNVADLTEGVHGTTDVTLSSALAETAAIVGDTGTDAGDVITFTGGTSGTLGSITISATTTVAEFVSEVNTNVENVTASYVAGTGVITFTAAEDLTVANSDVAGTFHGETIASTESSFLTDAGINSAITELNGALDTIRSQASTFGTNLSVVEARQSFTNQIISTLEEGAGLLTLADTNEEGANMLALQTRQQLSSVALSLASQADQNVLRLF